MAQNKPTEDSQCSTCIHYDEEYQGICPAFPHGIPADIISGNETHNKVKQDQMGDFVYVQDPEYIYPTDDIIKVQP